MFRRASLLWKAAAAVVPIPTLLAVQVDAPTVKAKGTKTNADVVAVPPPPPPPPPKPTKKSGVPPSAVPPPATTAKKIIAAKRTKTSAIPMPTVPLSSKSATKSTAAAPAVTLASSPKKPKKQTQARKVTKKDFAKYVALDTTAADLATPPVPKAVTTRTAKFVPATTPASQRVKDSLFDQFMSILNDDNVDPQSKAEEGMKFITSRFVANESQHLLFGVVSAWSEGGVINASTWKSMFDQLTLQLMNPYDGTFLASPSWQFCVSKDASITMLGPVDGDLKQRHVTTETVDRSGARKILALTAKQGSTQSFPVGIIHGAAGTGKTTDGVLTAECTTGAVQAVCARFTSKHFVDELTAIERFPDSRNVDRNNVVKKKVTKLVARAIPQQCRTVPNVKGVKTRFVLFFDEMGGHPNFVRGLCAVAKDLREEICKSFVGAKTEVVILVAGTGVEGTNHAAGSEPASYVMCDRTTNVWKTLTSGWKGTLGNIRKFVDARASRTASLAADVVQNARAAAAFCEAALDQFSGDLSVVVTDSLVKSLTRAACTKYKNLGALSTHKWDVYLKVMCQAIAAQHAMALDPGDFDWLVRKYGILTDRAVRKSHRESRPANFQMVPRTDYKNGTTVTQLWAPTNSPRYTMDAAQAAMMLSMFDLGDRAATGDGFEEAGMDYAVLCALIAYANRGSELPVRATTGQQLPSPWRPPFMFAERCVDAIATRRRPEPQSVEVHTLPRPVTITTAAQQVAQYFGSDAKAKTGGLSPGCFWLNATKADGPDGFCFVGNRVFLMQFKFLTSEVMTELDVFVELHKMGMRSDECIVAAWLAALQASPELLPLKKLPRTTAVKRFEELRRDQGTWTSVASSVYTDAIRDTLIGGEYLATFCQICAAATLKSFADAIRTRSDFGNPAPFLELFGKQKLKPTFVVMHCGVAPKPVTQTFGGHDVLLVTAPSQRTSDSSRLHDYFPIDVIQGGKKCVKIPVPS